MHPYEEEARKSVLHIPVPANNRETCSHCHATNDISVSRFCWRCGHNAVQPRILCDCERCYGALEKESK